MNYLSFKGVQYPVRVSYYALKQYQVETGKGIESIDEDLSNLEILLFHSLIAGSKAEDKDFPLKKEDMEFFLDESLADFNEILIGSFPDAAKSVGAKKK